MKKVAFFLILAINIVTFGGIIHVTSDFVNPKKSEIVYEGNVKAIIKEDNVELSSATLVVYKVNGKWDELKAIGDVLLVTSSVEANSREFFYTISEKKGNLKGNVVARITGQDATITSDVVNIDLNENRYFSEEGVNIVRKDVFMSSVGFDYMSDASILYLKDDFKATRTTKDSSLFILGSSATVNFDENELNVSSPVKVVLDYATITSYHLVYDLEKKGTMKGNVNGEITREGSITKFQSEFLDFDTEENVFIGYSKDSIVRIWREGTYIETRKFTYKKDEGVLIMEGEVFINDPKKNVKLWADKVVLYMDENEMKAWNAKTVIESE